MGKKRKYLKVLNSANENVPLESNNLVTNLVKESNNNNIKIRSEKLREHQYREGYA